jgi:hypothetical protein
MKSYKVKIENGIDKSIINVEPHKKFKFIKQTIDKVFPPIYKGARIYYFNRDISHEENTDVANIFKSNYQVSLKIVSDHFDQLENSDNLDSYHDLPNLTPSTNKKSKFNKKNVFFGAACNCGSLLVAIFCRKCNEYECLDCKREVSIKLNSNYLIFNFLILH